MDGRKNISTTVEANFDPSLKSVSRNLFSPVKKLLKFDEEPRPRRKKKKVSNKNEKMRNIISNIEKEIEEQLDTKTEDNDFTTSNVKGILKELIMDEDMKEMVRQTLHPGDSARCYEPKLTRAKVRKLLELRPDLKIPILWPISQTNTNFVSECLSLINENYSENSEDEEYKPENDESNYADFLLQNDSESSNSKRTSVEHFGIKSKSAFCGLNGEVLEVEENIGQRTRSKLPLTEKRLEEIEQTFNPPDITLDMYDCDIDNEDYLNFLRDYNTSYDSRNLEQTDFDDDLDDDPEYRIPEDEETVDKEELRRDESTEVPSAELWQLINEIIDDNEPIKALTERKKLFESNCDNAETIENNVSIITSVESTPEKETQNSPSPHDSISSYGRNPLELRDEIKTEPSHKNSDVNVSMLSKPQRLLFEQQLRQHVQLTTMHFLQCYKHPTLHSFSEEMKNALVTLKLLAESNKKSAYYASNLEDALKLISDWEKTLAEVPEPQINSSLKKKKMKKNRRFPPDMMKMVCKSAVFMYPLLLPEKPFSGYIDKTVRRKEITKSEEWLFSVGLQQFYEYAQNNEELNKNKNVMQEALKLINHYLLPQYTTASLRAILRKKKSKNPSESSVKYYLEHKKAPPLEHFVVPVSPVPLYEQPFDLLSEMWQTYITENFVVVKRG